MKINAPHYVVGFLFSSDCVVLIKKTHPKHMAGFWCGVGGKIEKQETCHEAMAREFEEETGVKTTQEDWKIFCHLQFPDQKITCYTSRPERAPDIKTTTDEKVEWLIADTICSAYCKDIWPDLFWLLPMALQCKQFAEAPTVTFADPAQTGD